MFELDNMENDEMCAILYINEKHFLKFQCTHCKYCFDSFENLATHLTNHYEEIKIGAFSEEEQQDTPGLEYSGVEETELLESDIDEIPIEDNFDSETITTIIEPDECIEIVEYEESSEKPIEYSESSSEPKESSLVTEPKAVKNKGRPSSKRWSNEFQCKVCGSSFKDKYVLAKHSLRHTGKKDFSCSQCSKKFYTRTEVKLHERRHNNERPYLCIFCGKTFVTTSNLDEHIKRHESVRPHKCDICGKGFHDKAELSHHRPVHSDERAFACEKCPSTFKQQKSLQAHMKIHLNKRQYRCKLCGASFNQGPALKSHQKTKHRNDQNASD